MSTQYSPIKLTGYNNGEEKVKEHLTKANNNMLSQIYQRRKKFQHQQIHYETFFAETKSNHNIGDKRDEDF